MLYFNELVDFETSNLIWVLLGLWDKRLCRIHPPHAMQKSVYFFLKGEK